MSGADSENNPPSPELGTGETAPVAPQETGISNPSSSPLIDSPPKLQEETARPRSVRPEVSVSLILKITLGIGVAGTLTLILACLGVKWFSEPGQLVIQGEQGPILRCRVPQSYQLQQLAQPGQKRIFEFRGPQEEFLLIQAFSSQSSDDTLRREFEREFRSRAGVQQLKISRQETRSYNMGGKHQTVHWAEALKEPGNSQPIYTLTAILPSSQGMACIGLLIPQSAYSETTIQEFFRSIH